MSCTPFAATLPTSPPWRSGCWRAGGRLARDLDGTVDYWHGALRARSHAAGHRARRHALVGRHLRPSRADLGVPQPGRHGLGPRPPARLLTRTARTPSCRRCCSRRRPGTPRASSTTARSRARSKTARAAGLTRACTRSTGSARPRRRSTRRSTDYLRFVERAVDHIGGPVNLVGDCQGGWLATIYAALHPEQVHTLTIAGAPIDFHAGDGVIQDYVQFLPPRDLRFYEGVVALGGGVLKGEFMLNGFIAHQARERDREAHPAARPHPRRGARRAPPCLRGLVQAHAGHPRRLLPLDRRAPVPRQRADPRRPGDRGAARRPGARSPAR